MKSLLGILMILAGIVLGCYVGGYLCFYGGIAAIIQQIALVVNGGQIVAPTLVFAIVRIIGTGCAGMFSACVLIFPGAVMLD